MAAPAVAAVIGKRLSGAVPRAHLYRSVQIPPGSGMAGRVPLYRCFQIPPRSGMAGRVPLYRCFQIRPGFSIAGPPKEANMDDLLRAINRLQQKVTKPERIVVNMDHEKRLAKLEALAYLGGILISGMIGYAFTVPTSINKLELEQSAMNGRLSSVEQGARTPAPAASAASPAQAAPSPSPAPATR